ncbi:MAG: acyltransferase [Sphingomonas sp.]|jgi:peptidoglycan/LPS O-acetylase OafA/YrhL|uniref:acyltransferase family protein n=1 Tax=Sphingomonas sp. TaxID=28214 RepID=UPI003567B308
MPDREAFEHPQHFTDLDGLRGILALSVVFLHYGINSAVLRLSHGYLVGFKFQLSVDFFFVLSGFVLAFSMRSGRPPIIAFATKRVFRLVPVHYACLLALLAISVAAPGPLPYLPNPLPSSTIFADFFLATPVIWQRDAVNVPSWSVSWELYLPILAVMAAPWIASIVGRHSRAIVIVLCALMAWVAMLVSDGAMLYGARACLGLAAGACLFQSRISVPRQLATPAVLYGLVILMLALMLASASFPAAAVIFPVAVFATILVGARTRSLLSSRPIAWLGSISYTLYMVHIPVLVAMALVFGDRINASIGLKGIAIALAIAAASALTILVERPAMLLGRRLRVRATAIA